MLTIACYIVSNNFVQIFQNSQGAPTVLQNILGGGMVNDRLADPEVWKKNLSLCLKPPQMCYSLYVVDMGYR
jgi:hypothetical protein